MNVQRRNSLLSATLLAAAATLPWDKWRRPRLGRIAVRSALYPCRISPVYGDTHIGLVSSRLPRDWSDHQQVARTQWAGDGVWVVGDYTLSDLRTFGSLKSDKVQGMLRCSSSPYAACFMAL
jgi:hypothetical protein